MRIIGTAEHVLALTADGPRQIRGGPERLQAFLAGEALGPADLGARVDLPTGGLRLPIDPPEVWAAGVTYARSRTARREETGGRTDAYDRVYTAERPELFLKAAAARAVIDGGPLHLRRDARWQVPEPELAAVLGPGGQIVGYTIGDDLTARDVEAENLLYLPQAKVWDRSCALGPGIVTADEVDPADLSIRLIIERQGRPLFEGQASTAQMVRSARDLVSWLGREYEIRAGTVLLTGTGIVPPDDVVLAPGDRVVIAIADWPVLTHGLD